MSHREKEKKAGKNFFFFQLSNEKLQLSLTKNKTPMSGEEKSVPPCQLLVNDFAGATSNSALLDTVTLRVLWCGVVWCGVVCGVVWCGVVWWRGVVCVCVCCVCHRQTPAHNTTPHNTTHTHTHTPIHQHTPTHPQAVLYWVVLRGVAWWG